MINKPLLQVVGVAADSVATLRIQPEFATLVGVKLELSGTNFDKTKIDKVKIKLGAKTISELTYDQLNKINNYKNGADNLRYLLIDFTERDQAIFPVKEMGGLDLMSLLAVGEVFIEIHINAAAVAPVITAKGYFTRQQKNPFVLKHVPFSFTQSASGRFTLPIQLRGALLKRIWLHYSGTNWTPTVNGNLSRLEVKKNGLVIFDQFDVDNRFDQAQFKKVPQANLFVYDCLIDNNHDAHIQTMRDERTAQGVVQVFDSFEFNAYLTDATGATVTAIAEVLDTPTNL